MESDRSENLVILVHGTFAKDAPWTDVGSSISKALEAAGFGTIAFKWSGKNSIRARIRAATELRDFICALREQKPNAQLHLVGHSHGGNIIRFALGTPSDVTTDLSENIKTTTFLGTPFLHYYKNDLRQMWRLIRISIIAMSLLLAIIYRLLSSFVSAAENHGLGMYQGDFSGDLRLAFATVVGFLCLGCITSLPVAFLATKNQRRYERFLCAIKHDRLSDLVITTKWDEALGLLRVLRIIPRTMQKLLGYCYEMLRVALRTQDRALKGRLIGWFAFLSAGLWSTLLWDTPLWPLALAFYGVLLFLAVFTLHLFSTFIVFSFSIYLAPIVSLLTRILQSNGLSFGWSPSSIFFAFSVSVSEAPLIREARTCRIIRVTPPPSEKKKLRHSSYYDDPVCIQHVLRHVLGNGNNDSGTENQYSEWFPTPKSWISEVFWYIAFLCLPIVLVFGIALL